MKNKILISIIILLLVCLLLESLYLIKVKKSHYRQSKDIYFNKKSFSQLPIYSLDEDLDIFDRDFDPFKEMERVHKEIDRMFKDIFNRGFVKGKFNFSDNYYNPDIDLVETDKDYILSMDLPGMEKDSINIEVKKGYLIISGRRDYSVEKNQLNRFYIKERQVGYFQRTIPLPHDANEKEIKVDYQKGVLKIIIPKIKEKQEEKNIRITI